MITISKIILCNFKRFEHLELDLDPEMNVFIGDNESGKSTVLQAIDIVSHGSRHRVEDIGVDRLFNVDAINSFMISDKNLATLPEMFIELYFNDLADIELEGLNNSKKSNCCGIKMQCVPNPNYSELIRQILTQPDATFPLEFYSVEFVTFAGNQFNGYNKKLKSIFIDNSQIGNPYSMREYVHDIYYSQLDEEQRISTKHAYHKSKNQFKKEILSAYSLGIAPYAYSVRESSGDNIETDIMLTEDDVPLENKGTGTLCFIKTKLSLDKAINGIDAVLIEEPENHLSHTKMLQLIQRIKDSQDRQLFISTHSDMISTRLNLQKCILMNSTTQSYTSLLELSDNTAKFFMKAPDNNILKFVLSNKVILVEGDAEFILMEAMYKRITKKEFSGSGISVIAVDGKCFKRYLEIAKILNIKVAVITDNDHDFAANITDSYSDYIQGQFPNIMISSDTDNQRYTFEVCVYEDNQEICNILFNTPHRKVSIQQYMLSNKAEAAYELLCNNADNIDVPPYIEDSIKWIDV
jgi:predicted ATP-dependent endonuclease of OLD family